VDHRASGGRIILAKNAFTLASASGSSGAGVAGHLAGLDRVTIGATGCTVCRGLRGGFRRGFFADTIMVADVGWVAAGVESISGRGIVL